MMFIDEIGMAYGLWWAARACAHSFAATATANSIFILCCLPLSHTVLILSFISTLTFTRRKCLWNQTAAAVAVASWMHGSWVRGNWFAHANTFCTSTYIRWALARILHYFGSKSVTFIAKLEFNRQAMCHAASSSSPTHITDNQNKLE